MSWFHWLQCALAVAGWGICVNRVHRMRFRSALDTRPYLQALSDALLEYPARAIALLRGADQTDVGRLAAVLVDPDASAEDGELMELALRQEALVGIGALRTLARIASPLALVGVMFELSSAFGGGDGLVALQRGLAARLAMEQALLGMSLGLCTTLSCAVAASLLQRAARMRFAELRLTAEVIAETRLPREET